jgi:hypothetical protein
MWQQLADERIEDAGRLLDPGAARWSAAYYLIGYSVECGLKSCVLRHVAAHSEVIFQQKEFSREAWTHDIEALVKLAGMRDLRNDAVQANPVLGTNWQLVKDWNEKSRYELKTKDQAEQLYSAVTDPNNGVMPWIRAHW